MRWRSGTSTCPRCRTAAAWRCAPLFTPAVIPAHRGMVVEVPLPLAAMPGAADAGRAARLRWRDFYAGSPVVRDGRETADGELLLRASTRAERRASTCTCSPRPMARRRGWSRVLDNLGKGASGAAVQILNLMAGPRRDRRAAALSCPKLQAAPARNLPIGKVARDSLRPDAARPARRSSRDSALSRARAIG